MKQKHSFLRFLATTLILCFVLTVNAQDADKAQRLEKITEKITKDSKVEKVIMSEERETPYMVTFNKDIENPYMLDQAKELIEHHLDVKKTSSEFQFDKEIKLAHGMSVHRFEQYYKGVKVEHGDYVALSTNGKLASINGEYYDLTSGVQTTATLTEEQALESALANIGAQHYAHDYLLEHFNGVIAPEHNSAWSKAYKEYYPEGELVIIDDYSTINTYDLDLAYKFNVYATVPLSRDYVYVNAHTGKVMFKNPIIKHATTPVANPIPVKTRYSGTQNMYISEHDVADGEPNPLFDATGGSSTLTDSRTTNSAVLTNLPYTDGATAYVLIDQSKLAKYGTTATIETYDVNGAGGVPLSVPIYGQARSFTDNDLMFDGEFGSGGEHVRGLASAANPAERQHDDDIAWDAHWGAGVVYDYWQDIHGRDSYDNNSASIYSYVHIGNAFDNAFWNGTAMSYGDGQGFKPLTSLDVCGHEIGHAVCSNTSDLIYAKQSGGMNEGFSDIWAACTEYYQIQIDPTLAYHPTNNAGGYRPFGIGEQIDSPGSALRWMDSPKVARNPDTFGGVNWQETEDCDPSLANDQCGVHGNSGVLNKWFYLMTVGSGAGSGPDAVYAGTGANADDNVNDNGEAYNVTGLGFKVSELITFGTEVMLTANGTFAEARLVSIDFCRNLDAAMGGGICADAEIQTTNAWHGVGVGDVFDCSALDGVVVGFITDKGSISELAATSECNATTTVKANIFYISTLGAQDLVVDGSSTATEGKDFFITNKTVANAGDSYQTAAIEIEVVDDAEVEGSETIVLKFATNSNAEFDTYTLTINDDDVTPRIGNGPITLLTEDFSSGALPADWMIMNYVQEGPNAWYFGATTASTVFTDAAYIAEIEGSDTYNGNLGNNDMVLFSKSIDARGIADVTVSFDWGAGGERDAGINATPFDYGELVYSFDNGVTFQSRRDLFIGTGTLVVVPESGTFTKAYPALDGKVFRVGFRWFNDPLVGNGASFAVDNLIVTGTAAAIETNLNDNTSERVDANTEVYFLSTNDAEVLVDINNAASDMGCVDVSIAQEGVAATALTDGMRAEKVFDVNAGTGTGISHDITLYFTLAELGGFTGSETALNVVQMKGDITQTTPTGTTIDATTVATAITDPSDASMTIGYTYTSSAFDGNGKYSVTNATQENALAVELVELKATAQDKAIALNWATATETDNKGFEVLRSTEADKNFEVISWTAGQGTSTETTRYNFVDTKVEGNVTYFYQLRMVNFNGEVDYSNIVSAVVKGNDNTVVIAPNPATDYVNVTINDVKMDTKITILSVDGQILSTQNVDGNTTQLDLSNYPAGVYFIRMNTAAGSTTNKVVKQ